MKYTIAIAALLVGALLVLSPMIFTETGTHPDRPFHAQWMGFIVIIGGIILGYKTIRTP